MTTDKTHVVWHPHSVSREDRERLNGHAGLRRVVHGPVGLRQEHGRQPRRSACCTSGHPQLRARWRQRAARPERLAGNAGRLWRGFARRFGLTFAARRPAGKHPPHRRGGRAVCLGRARHAHRLCQPLPGRSCGGAGRSVNASRPGSFIEVFVDAPLDVCEARDPKGCTRKPAPANCKNFTGIDDPYEPPENPELRLDAAAHAPEVLSRSSAGMLAGLKKDFIRIGGRFALTGRRSVLHWGGA